MCFTFFFEVTWQPEIWKIMFWTNLGGMFSLSSKIPFWLTIGNKLCNDFCIELYTFSILHFNLSTLIVAVSNIHVHGIKTYKSPDVIFQKSTIYIAEHNTSNLLYAFLLIFLSLLWLPLFIPILSFVWLHLLLILSFLFCLICKWTNVHSFLIQRRYWFNFYLRFIIQRTYWFNFIRHDFLN